jgi:aromatic-amino-acid transaminase
MQTQTTYSGVVPGVRDRLGDDEIFALHRLAMERASKGESILNSTLGTLATEDGQLAVMPSVLETMARLQGPVTAGYAPVAGKPEYLRAVIADCFGDGPLASQAVSAAVPGGSGAIYQAVVNFLEPGQKLLATNFHWGPYPGIARNIGRDFEKFDMFTEEGAFDVEALSAAVDRHIATQGRVLVVLNFPCHNPTGYSLDAQEWRATVEVLRAAGERAPVTVLFDIAYFWFAGSDAKTWVDWVPELLETTTVLVAWTASKSYCQYGSRTGAIIGLHRDASELDQMRNAFGYTCRGTWSNCNHLGQLGAAELILDPTLNARWAAERDELVGLIDKRIVVFNDLAAKAGLRMPRYENGFFLIVYTADSDRTAAAMRDEGVFVLPIPGAVRVALCHTPKKDLPRLVDALKVGVAAAG